MMRHLIAALAALTPFSLASPTVFSVHDDLLAFPQYEVIFSDSFISESELDSIRANPSSSAHDSSTTSDSKSIESQHDTRHKPDSANSDHVFDPSSETYELMWLHGEQYLCTIPVVDTPARNETSEAEARVAEQKELARATDRGWELLQDLEGNCLYFISGWWSYSFCYNSEITQFHQLPPQPGKPPFPPQPDPTTKSFVLGKAKTPAPTKEDEWGNQIEVHKPRKDGEPPLTELQVKGDTRYLVQKMEGGTTCDLTGKPRRVEVQFHCNPQVTDRIGYIKEVTTCSYLMVVYTPRLCNDVAFMPPKESKANPIICRAIVPEDELEYQLELKSLVSELEAASEDVKKPINIGGIILGGGKFIGKEGQRMPIPANFGKENEGRTVQVIAKAQSKADGGQVEMASDAKLQRLDLDPEVVAALRTEVQKMAEDKGWKIEVVDEPGHTREILGIVDGGDEFEDDSTDEEGEEGSQEIYKDEL